MKLTTYKVIVGDRQGLGTGIALAAVEALLAERCLVRGLVLEAGACLL